MSVVLYIPDSDRKLTDVEIRGWPIIISTGILYGAMAIHPLHRMNVTNKYEVHLAQRSYDELTTDLAAWPGLERELDRIIAGIKAIGE